MRTTEKGEALQYSMPDTDAFSSLTGLDHLAGSRTKMEGLSQGQGSWQNNPEHSKRESALFCRRAMACMGLYLQTLGLFSAGERTLSQIDLLASGEARSQPDPKVKAQTFCAGNPVFCQMGKCCASGDVIDAEGVTLRTPCSLMCRRLLNMTHHNSAGDDKHNVQTCCSEKGPSKACRP